MRQEVQQFKYSQAADRIRSDIEAGIYKGMLPREAELSDMFSVSRGTLRQALRLLKNEGLIQPQQGRGTVILDRGSNRGVIYEQGKPLSEEEQRSRIRLNFFKWKYLVGLDHTNFPRLHDIDYNSLSPDLGLHLNLDQRDVIRETMEAAKTEPRVALEVNSGHGATTIARYVEKELLERDPHILPVRITWSRLGTEVDVTSSFEESVRVAIARYIVNNPLEDSQRSEHVEQQTRKLQNLLWKEYYDTPHPRPALTEWRKVWSLSPILVDTPLPDLIRYAHEVFGVDLMLLLDLSGENDKPGFQQRLDSLVRAVSSLQSGEAQKNGPIAKQVYFANQSVISSLRGTYDMPEMKIWHFPPHEQADVYALIRNHHPRKIPGTANMYDSISTVVDPNFLSEIKANAESEESQFHDLRLDEMIGKFEEMIFDEMNRPWHTMPFFLSASPKRKKRNP